MPYYEGRVVLGAAKGAKAFLDLSLGLTRGPVPEPPAKNGDRVRELEQELSGRDQRIAELQSSNQSLRKRMRNRDRRKVVEGERPAEDSHVEYEGVVLPPRNLRPCGNKLRDDEFYLKSARQRADWLVQNAGLTEETSLLDVGSGPGRLAIGLIQQLGGLSKYRGADVSEQSIRWAEKHITPHHPNFQFVHLDARSTRYNPTGAEIDETFRFPFEEEEFDLVCLYSVFSHMLADDVRAYLKDFHRILRPDGRILITAFVEEGVPDVTENPEGYKDRDWSGPLHCVRYSRSFFEQLLKESGLTLDSLEPSRDKYQNLLYISKSGV